MWQCARREQKPQTGKGTGEKSKVDVHVWSIWWIIHNLSSFLHSRLFFLVIPLKKKIKKQIKRAFFLKGKRERERERKRGKRTAKEGRSKRKKDVSKCPEKWRNAANISESLPLLAVRRHLSEFTAFNFFLLFVLDVTYTSEIPEYPTVEITKRGLKCKPKGKKTKPTTTAKWFWKKKSLDFKREEKCNLNKSLL